MDVSPERLDLLKQQIDKITGDKAKDYYPVTSLNKKTVGFHWSYSFPFDFDWWLSIDNNGTTSPKNVINQFAMNLGSSITREDYVNSGIQDGARRMMEFLNTKGVHLDDIINAIDLGDTALSIAKNMIWDYVKDYAEQVWDNLLTPWKIPDFFPPVPDIDNLVTAIKESLNENPKICDIFSNYDGGVSKTVDDLLNVAYNGLKGFNSVDDILTFAFSVGDIYKNHCTLQSICWLRSYDDWYAISK